MKYSLYLQLVLLRLICLELVGVVKGAESPITDDEIALMRYSMVLAEP